MDQNPDVIDLQKRIREAREGYYNLSPLMTDDEYDGLLAKLKELDPSNPEISAVGAKAPKVSVWEKVQHIIPMGSLNKANSEEEFREWAAKTGAQEFLMCHKLDGSSLEIVYTDGQLDRGITRGDGMIGEDITENIVQIPSIPKTLTSKKGVVPGTVVVRGEVIMLKNVFQSIYAAEYANPRNTAAGKLRDKKSGGSDCQNLSFFAFELMLGEQKPETEAIKFEALKALGFHIPKYAIGNIDGMVAEFKGESVLRGSLPYEIDGEVISVNNSILLEELGELNLRPRGKVAWKFSAETVVTKMSDVKWQVGPTGRCTPVAIVEPARIGGVTVTRLSLHNIKMFRDLNLHLGDEVLIKRAGDTIPYLVKNMTRGVAIEADDS